MSYSALADSGSESCVENCENMPETPGRWSRTEQASCLSIRLYISGMTTDRPSTGEVKQSRHRRLTNAAIRYAGKCLHNNQQSTTAHHSHSQTNLCTKQCQFIDIEDKPEHGLKVGQIMD